MKIYHSAPPFFTKIKKPVRRKSIFKFTPFPRQIFHFPHGAAAVSPFCPQSGRLAQNKLHESAAPIPPCRSSEKRGGAPFPSGILCGLPLYDTRGGAKHSFAPPLDSFCRFCFRSPHLTCTIQRRRKGIVRPALLLVAAARRIGAYTFKSPRSQLLVEMMYGKSGSRRNSKTGTPTSG